MKVIQKKMNINDYYALLDLKSLCVGDILVFDVFIKKENDYIIIIEAGTKLSQDLYEKLKKQLSLYIFVKDKDKLELTYKNLSCYIKHNKDCLEKRINLIYTINNELFKNYLEDINNKINLDCVNQIVGSLLILIKYDDYILKNTMPYFLNDNNLSNHSLHVAIYAMKLASELKLENEELIKIGIAGLLHDVGVKKVNESFINKSTKLDMVELEEVQKHVEYSVEILKENNIKDICIINAVMQHHEQYDGNGYPEKLTKDKISLFASIIYTCGVFDALTSTRPHRKQYSSFEALKMMLTDKSMDGKFNHNYIKIFLKLL
jgi:putative nucleotidyltransferase with HDIG domain